eukprot:CAMPEP_0176248296 /NCGR_PEP_ID=MMETSP0121_2-20121125/33395_1 /TAXON_ID=160619 /ORGANISM="Kryptoperidinium foliaceum, Strain CCMP 1326" /LENGTH=63 /DNA_ID=CAMNT_0017587973 /DNA_START=38 /DNA_END=226 /DNA_ORIENTATION=-
MATCPPLQSALPLDTRERDALSAGQAARGIIRRCAITPLSGATGVCEDHPPQLVLAVGERARL